MGLVVTLDLTPDACRISTVGHRQRIETPTKTGQETERQPLASVTTPSVETDQHGRNKRRAVHTRRSRRAGGFALLAQPPPAVFPGERDSKMKGFQQPTKSLVERSNLAQEALAQCTGTIAEHGAAAGHNGARFHFAVLHGVFVSAALYKCNLSPRVLYFFHSGLRLPGFDASQSLSLHRQL